MVFTLGKAKQGTQEGSIGSDTFRRWREVATKAFSGAPEGSSGPTELGELAHDPGVVLIDDDLPSWPDPRAGISMTREAEARPGTRSEGADWVLAPESEVRSAERTDSAATEVQTSFTVVAAPLLAAGGGAGSAAVVGGESAQVRAYDTSAMLQGGVGGGSMSRPQLRAVSGGAVWTDDMERVGPVTRGPRQAPPRTPAQTQQQTAAPQQPIASEPLLGWEQELRQRFGNNLKSALSKGTIIEGTFSFDSPVCIDGTLVGEVQSTSTLIVGPNATVSATIEVGSLIVLGSVSGPVVAVELVEVKAGGRLEGDVVTKRIAIEDGGYFLGHCRQRVLRRKTDEIMLEDEVAETPSGE